MAAGPQSLTGGETDGGAKHGHGAAWRFPGARQNCINQSKGAVALTEAGISCVGFDYPMVNNWELCSGLLLKLSQVPCVDSLTPNYVAELTPNPPLQGEVNLCLFALPGHLFSQQF